LGHQINNRQNPKAGVGGGVVGAAAGKGGNGNSNAAGAGGRNVAGALQLSPRGNATAYDIAQLWRNYY